MLQDQIITINFVLANADLLRYQSLSFLIKPIYRSPIA